MPKLSIFVSSEEWFFASLFSTIVKVYVQVVCLFVSITELPDPHMSKPVGESIAYMKRVMKVTQTIMPL